MALSFMNYYNYCDSYGKVAQLGTAPDSKSGKWMLFTRGFKSHPFLITNKEAGVNQANAAIANQIANLTNTSQSISRN